LSLTSLNENLNFPPSPLLTGPEVVVYLSQTPITQSLPSSLTLCICKLNLSPDYSTPPLDVYFSPLFFLFFVLNPLTYSKPRFFLLTEASQLSSPPLVLWNPRYRSSYVLQPIFTFFFFPHPSPISSPSLRSKLSLQLVILSPFLFCSIFGTRLSHSLLLHMIPPLFPSPRVTAIHIDFSRTIFRPFLTHAHPKSIFPCF